MTAIWAHCDGCERWFYCDDADAREAHCPVCFRPPSQVVREEEATDSVA
jgi:hypothetical protein